MTRLVVGLGNPGPEYEWTPHNVGFHALDVMAKETGQLFQLATRLPDHSGPKQFAWARLQGPDWDQDALLVKPTTWMNRSGRVVAPLALARDVASESILVIYDDIDLPLGALRIRPHGGTGGHNGMRSLRDALGTDRFPRLRIGVGRPKTDAARHVLTRLSGADLVEAEISVAQAAEAALDWLATGDLEQCMTRYHSRWNQS